MIVTAFVAGLGLAGCLYYWNRSIKRTLPDGRVVVYVEMLKGKKVSRSEFEPDVYAYPNDWFRDDQQGLRDWIRWFREFRLRPKDTGFTYSRSPELLIGYVIDPKASGSLRSVMQDGFGFSSGYDWPVQSSGYVKAVNYDPLPKGSRQWQFDFKDQENKSLAQLSVPNRWFRASPRFHGQPPPLACGSAKGTLKLVSADFTLQRRRNVDMKFDASGCASLLPCRVVGARVTDAFGNTQLIGGQVDKDGKTIHTSWGNMEGGIFMQSPEWKVRIAVCRDRGAMFAPGEIVRFDRLPADERGKRITGTRVRGRELNLLQSFRFKPNAHDSRPWLHCRFMWELDDKGPLLWPIVTKVVGRSSDGVDREIDPDKCPERLEGGDYWIIHEDCVADWGMAHIPVLTTNPRFKSGLLIPRDIEEYDLHVALEEPTVFEFQVKITNWPQ